MNACNTMKALVGIALPALALAACGDDGGVSSVSYDRPEDIAEAIGCEFFPIADSAESFGFGTDFVEAEGSCDFDGEEVDLVVYNDEEARKTVVLLDAEVSCASAEDVGISEFSWVLGANWSASPDTATTARSIADATGGSVETISCE